MNDDRRGDEQGDDNHELTFESGYGAQDKVLKEGETLEDVAGVSEEDVRKDVRETQIEESDEDKSDEA